MGHRLRANPGSWARAWQLLPHSLGRTSPLTPASGTGGTRLRVSATRCVAICGAQCRHFQLSQVFTLGFLSSENSQDVLFIPRELGRRTYDQVAH